MTTTKKIDKHDVHMAIQAIGHFYKKYGADFNPTVIVDYSIALYEFYETNEYHEYTPLEKAFRRIIIRRPTGTSRRDHIFLVIGYHGLDEAKTEELNDLVNRFTKNVFVAE